MININRHNYEEFFLLYVDRELSASERMAVEQFVQENPDLIEEFNTLQQTLLPEDHRLEMPDKTSLYRTVTEGINMENYTGYFLMYVDNELSKPDIEAVETFVLQHPELQALFVQLKQTQLPAENILFPHKSLLYRSEEPEKKPVVYIRWWRMAAAAAVIGLGFMLWTMVPDNLQNTNAAHKPLSAKNNTVLPLTDLPATNNTTSSNLPLASIETNNKNISVDIVNKIPVQESLVINIPNATAINEKVNRPDVIIDKAEIMGSNGITRSAIVMPNLTGITAGNAIHDHEIIKTAAVSEPVENQQDALMQQVVYKELDTDADSENKSLLIGTVEINKDKLRGIFRKATSIFRSKRVEEERAETVGTGPSRPLK